MPNDSIPTHHRRASRARTGRLQEFVAAETVELADGSQHTLAGHIIKGHH
jgi:hypothetical protein